MLPYLLALGVYILVFAIQVRRFKSPGVFNRMAMLGILTVGIIAHGFQVLNVLISPAGVDFGFFQISSLIAFFFGLLLLISATRIPIDNLFIALLPVSIIALTLSQFMPSEFTPKTYSSGMLLHIVISILAYSIMTISAAHAILILMLDNRLKSHHPGGLIWGLPPLQTMERLHWQMLITGIIGLTLAIVTGFVYVDDIFAQHLIHKTVLTIIAWLVYSTLMIGHWKNGWRGKVAASWTLSAFGILVIAFMGSKFVLELVLGRV